MTKKPLFLLTIQKSPETEKEQYDPYINQRIRTYDRDFQELQRINLTAEEVIEVMSLIARLRERFQK